MASDFYAATAAAANSSRWLTEEVFKLIDMVQHDEAIYNPRHKYYFCRPYVENFWREVDQKLEKNPGASLAKWTNLRISFRREYTNYLEEKVPPCWSYFDRMFFLHPYLRKKHQQTKSLDSQVQDALVQISTLSSRLQRERAVNAAASAVASLNAVNNSRHLNSQQQLQPPLDNYLDYFDESEQNNSELDEIIDEEQQSRFQHLDTQSLNNDIKSECEDNVDDYDNEVRHDVEDDVEADDTEMRKFVLDSLASSASAAAQEKQRQQQQLRLQHLNRLQTRSYHEDLRAKRPRSQESISSTQQAAAVAACNIGGGGSSSNTQRSMLCTSTPAHSNANVSFVRPTFASKPADTVSTTTNSNATVGGGGSGNSNSGACQNIEMSSTVGAAIAGLLQSAAPASSHAHVQQQRHTLPHHHYHHRLELAAAAASTASSSTLATAAATVSGLSGGSAAANTTTNAPHLELCDCKTDPDAMFLMSLLPDIQKLNGRDRGKIKIAFQNILQDYLYPE